MLPFCRRNGIGTDAKTFPFCRRSVQDAEDVTDAETAENCFLTPVAVCWRQRTVERWQKCKEKTRIASKMFPICRRRKAWCSLFVAEVKNLFPICRRDVPKVSQRCSLFVAPCSQSVAGRWCEVLSIKQLRGSTNLRYIKTIIMTTISLTVFLLFYKFFNPTPYSSQEPHPTLPPPLDLWSLASIYAYLYFLLRTFLSFQTFIYSYIHSSIHICYYIYTHLCMHITGYEHIHA